MGVVNIKYPSIKIKLTGEDGNAFNIIGRYLRAMRRANISKSEQDKFINQAQSGDFNHLLKVCMKWFDVE